MLKKKVNEIQSKNCVDINNVHGDKKSIRCTSFPRIKYGAKKLNSHKM